MDDAGRWVRIDERSDAPELGHGQLHLWRIPTQADTTLVQARARLLDPGERQRMQRFRYARLRDSFALRHGALRLILGRYLGVDAPQVRFATQALGKPQLDSGDDPPPLHFNLSDSGEWALLGISRTCRLGVDVEQVRPLSDLEAVARDHFSATELAALATLPADEVLTAFFNCWTRKEAWLKATGSGLSVPLDSFDVTLAPHAPPRLLRVAGSPEDAARWWLWAGTVAQGYPAAAAVEGPPAQVVSFHFG